MVLKETRIFTCDLCDVERLDASDYFNHLFNRLHQIGLENSSTLTSLPLERIIGRLTLVDGINLKDAKILNLEQPLNYLVYKVDILLRLNEYLRLEQEGFLSQISDKPNPIWLEFFISIIEVCYDIKFGSSDRNGASSTNSDTKTTLRDIIESKCLQLGVQFLEKFFALLATSQTPPSVVATFGSSKYHIRHYWTKCISLLLNCDFSDDSKGVEYRLAINYLAEKLIPGKGLLVNAG